MRPGAKAPGYLISAGVRDSGHLIFAGLVDGEVAVEVNGERRALDLHGVDLQVVETDLIAGGLGGLGEQLAEQCGGVDLHLLGEFAAEEGLEEEVELGRLAEVLDAGVAEADGLALGVGDDGDVGFGVEGDAEAGSVKAGAKFGVGFDVDDDAVAVEADLRVLGVGVAGGGGLAAEVVAAVLVEELLVQRALEGLVGDVELNGVGGGGDEREGCEGKRWSKGAGVHGNSIRDGRGLGRRSRNR